LNLISKERNREKVRRDPGKLASYDAMNDKMLATGIKYRMGENFSPFDYNVLRLAFIFGGGIIGMLIEPIYLVVGVILGAFIVPFYFNYENNNDNNEMLQDIGVVYGIVSLQVKNGVFLTKVLYECHLNVEYPRLKKALMELSIDIEKFGSVGDAAIRFRKKFNNKYIDTFAKTLEQSQKTGSSVQMFDDIAESLEHIEEAIALRKEKKVEMRGFLFQTLIFVSIFVFVFYILMTSFNDMGGLV